MRTNDNAEVLRKTNRPVYWDRSDMTDRPGAGRWCPGRGKLVTRR